MYLFCQARLVAPSGPRGGHSARPSHALSAFGAARVPQRLPQGVASVSRAVAREARGKKPEARGPETLFAPPPGGEEGAPFI